VVVLAKNYETMSTFVEVMQKKTVASFFLDTVYSRRRYLFRSGILARREERGFLSPI